MNKPLLVILGPTASGKTKLAVNLALKLKGEIISGDSRQVYRRMDIGTGKDYGDYETSLGKVPFHLIDIVDPGEQYDLSNFLVDFKHAYEDILKRRALPILCGGSGLYLEAVMRGYSNPRIPVNEQLREELIHTDHEVLKKRFAQYSPHHALAKVDLSTKKRSIRAIEMAEYLETNPYLEQDEAQYNLCVIGIDPGRDLRRNLIEKRLKNRLEAGLVNEVESLLKTVDAEQLIRYGLEYKYITHYLHGDMGYDEMVSSLLAAIHQFAKRQMTYFRKMERTGIEIRWVNEDGFKEVLPYIRGKFKKA